jgi:hypothetical protein
MGFKLILACGLMLGGMWLAAAVGEVAFVGPIGRTAYKLLGVAVGCGAIYGILAYNPAGASNTAATGAAATGTFAAVVAYFVLFKFLLRLNVRDAAICTVITWILVTLANYFAFKLDGAVRDAWV